AAKKLARRSSDLLTFGPSRKPRRGRFHHHPETLRTFWLQLGDDGRDLSLYVVLAHRGWEVLSQHPHLGSLAARRVRSSRLSIDVDRLLTTLHLFAGDPDDEVVVDR